VSVLVGHVSDGVEDPVHLGGPSSMVGVVHLFGEVLQSVLLVLLQRQRLAQVGDVVEALQLRHPTAQQQREEVDEEAGVLTDGQICFITHLLKPERHITLNTQVLYSVRVCVCVCVYWYIWFMRTQICIMTWVLQRKNSL